MDINDRVTFRNPILPELALIASEDTNTMLPRLIDLIGDEVGTVIDAGGGYMLPDGGFVPVCAVVFEEAGQTVYGLPELAYELA